MTEKTPKPMTEDAAKRIKQAAEKKTGGSEEAKKFAKRAERAAKRNKDKQQ